MITDYTQAADAELLREYAANRSDEAFAEIVGRYQQIVYSVCLRILGNTHDAEEAAQA